MAARRSNRTYMMFVEDAVTAAQAFANADRRERYVLQCNSGIYRWQWYVTANPPRRAYMIAGGLADDELVVYPDDI